MNVQHRQQGFTLIELLVVVAIIAVLIAMLMPALQNVRYQAKLLKCQSQQHHLAIAMLVYADDHDDWLLPPSYGNPTTTYCNDIPQSSWHASRFWFDLLPYIGAVNVQRGDTLARTGDVFYCPSAPDFRVRYGSGWGSETAGVQYISYANYCRWGEEYIAPPYTLKGSPAKLGENGQKIMFGDITSPTHWIWRMHGCNTAILEGGNFAHLDGHVAWFDRDDLYGLTSGPAWEPANDWLHIALPYDLRFRDYVD